MNGASMKKRAFFSAVAIAVVLTGCGVSKKQIDSASERLDKLTSSGLPDSLLFTAKSDLFDAKQAIEEGQGSLAKESYKRAIEAMENAEDVLAKSLSEKKPQMVNKLASLKESSKAELTGMHLAVMDSVIDTLGKLIDKDWILEAEKDALLADSMLASLKTQQEKANQLRTAIIGEWTFEKHITSTVDYTVDAKEHKIFTFHPDGKASFIEQKKGKSGHSLKEDWRFESYGKWDIKGDTIHVRTSRFACVKQNFEEEKNVDGKVVWEKANKPTYDSTITDGSQDRYVTYTSLMDDFIKK